ATSIGLVAAACGGTTTTPTASATGSAAPAVTKTLNIGFTNSQTGAQQVASQKQTEGIKLWVDQVTKAGGIKLKDGTVLMPKITFYDDGSAADPYAESKGLQVVVNQGYDAGTTDFAPFINQIVAAAPDAIIGGGHLVDGTAFAKALKEKNVSARFVALLVAPPEPTFADIGDAANFTVGPSQWEIPVKYNEAAAKALNIPFYGITSDSFTSAYRAMFNSAPSYHSAGGFAAGLILQRA